MPSLTPGAAPGRQSDPVALGHVLRAVRPLLPHEFHAARTMPLLFGVLLGTVLCAAAPAFLQPPDPSGAVTLLRFAAVLGGLGLAFVLDDPASDMTAVCPSPCWLRRLLRVIGGLMVLTAVWWLDIALLMMALPDDARSALPLADLAAECLIVALVAVALTLVGLRLTRGLGGGLLGGAGVVLFAVALAVLPAEAAFYAQPDDVRGWAESLPRWRLLGAVALSTTVFLLPRQPSGKS
ncbi:hypothetical protein [Streptomyces albipurpureus]|uniref:ABC transporter n=1 Tax=Streptomyces albipurpureus TaxID=2897419 RepID=A0ABT0UFF8_9ACTN|nr:hypothetical protein [Streptomyces sp. CWNU-1]MCM2386856.1 hypothetical protein [Streptomyces sp. CWNU-1]